MLRKLVCFNKILYIKLSLEKNNFKVYVLFLDLPLINCILSKRNIKLIKYCQFLNKLNILQVHFNKSLVFKKVVKKKSITYSKLRKFIVNLL